MFDHTRMFGLDNQFRSFNTEPSKIIWVKVAKDFKMSEILLFMSIFFWLYLQDIFVYQNLSSSYGVSHHLL